MKKPYWLSKSRVVEYLQCPKRLYLNIHQPDLKVEDASTLANFEVGHKIGAIAQALYPEGLMIGDESNNLTLALQQTQETIQSDPDRVLFEATFKHDGILIRADLLVPENGKYRMIEVKSSTTVKDYHIKDCAIQSWVIENAGINLNGIALMHVDNSFIYRGGNKYNGLLKADDISAQVEATRVFVPQWLNGCRETLNGDMPDIEVGNQCTSPFSCPFLNHCTKGQPEFPVTLLPGTAGKRVAKQLMALGYEDLTLVPEATIQEADLDRIVRITRSGTYEVDHAAKEVIDGLPYPRYYLDFETIQFAIPIWEDTRPYEQLPFQWSCHVEHDDGSIQHLEFLDLSDAAPMRHFAESLVSAVGEQGPILVYNKGFESGRIQYLADLFSDLASALEAIKARIVDLLPIARQNYYHPAMKGSWSIKAVLPTIAPDLDYASLDEVRDGGGAQLAYLEAISKDADEARREKLRKSLLAYCERDTWAMVRLARFLATPN